ncbi:MAG: class I SAM-dependent methyltransferase, partial [Phenylobacterium sp.]
MLEIGVSQGGSLGMWRSYFGPEATIFGVDVDPACAERFDPPNQVRIGSQDDPAFLRSVVSEMGGLDIVLDDGSHVAPHQETSFRTLFPLLATGGLYIIEDTHTAYWPTYDGGYRRRGTAIELAKVLIDDMHAFYHGRPEVLASRSEVGAVLIFDSIIVIEKVDRPRPGHTRT